MKIRNILSAVAACAVAATAFIMPASAADSYTAAITFQTSSYIYRNTLSQPSCLYWDNDLGEPADYEGASWVDATITGDGTYTVELNGIKDGGWNMLKLDTTLDLDATPDVTITVKTVELNGAAVDFDAEAAAMNGNSDKPIALKSDEYSAWDFDISNGVRAQIINVYDGVAAVANEGYESIKITFEVDGLDADTSAPAGDTGATTPSTDKGSPDTGVEGIAVVAGAAIVAGGVMLLSKKRQ